MYGLTVWFANKDDENKLYYGDLMTNPANVNEHTIYIDVVDPVSFNDNTADWKNQYVKSVGMDDIVYVGTHKDFEEKAPELYLD